MAERIRTIGLSLGADICWPICYEELVRRLDLAIPYDGDTLRFHVERVTIEPFDLRQPSRYDVVIDRLTHWYHTSREWIKEGDPPQRSLRLQQSLVAAVQREADHLLRHDAARAAGARHLADPAQGLQAQRRPAADAGALRPLLRPRRDRPQVRLSAVHEAVRRRRLGGRQQDRRRAGAVAGLRAQRHADHEPAGGRRALRLFRALHRPRAADPLRQLRSGRAAARSLPARHRLPGRRRTARCSRT